MFCNLLIEFKIYPPHLRIKSLMLSKLNFDVDKSSVTNWVIGQIKADSIGKISLSKLSELLTSEKAQL